MARYEITAPNGQKFEINAPDDATQDQVMAYAQSEFSKTQTAAPDAGVGFAQGLMSGAERGVKQTLGGITQKVAQARKSQLDSNIQDMIAKMQSGEIAASPENFSQLDNLQSQAVKLAQDLSGFEGLESSQRADYSKLQEAAPASSTIGNIAGQMVALPIPGLGQARLPAQMMVGASTGALTGAIQPTVGDESNTNETLMGAGIGGATPAVLRPITSAIGGAYRSAIGRQSPELQSVTRYADENKLPLMTSDVIPPTTFAGGSARSLGEKIPITGTGAPRAEQQVARVNELKKISDQYGIPSDTEIVESLNRKSDRLSAAAGKRYNSTIEAMADTPIPLNATIKTIDEQINQYTKPGAVQNPAVIGALQQFKDQITSGNNNLELLRQNRTLFRELIKGEDTVMSDSAKRVNDAVYRSITQDMQSAVASKLGSQSAAALRQVDGIWAREAQQLKNTKLKNIFSKGNIKPEEATKMLFSNDRTEAKTLYDALDTKGRQNARAAIISRAIDRANESPERFANEMKKLRNQSDVFFRGSEKKQLEGLVNYLNYTREAGKASLITPTGQQALQVGVPVGVMADISTTGGLGTAGFATIGLAARAYESKPVRNLMIKMASIPKGSTQFEKAAALLEQELQKAATKAPQSLEKENKPKLNQ
jgi:hypothetical protein